MKEPAGTLLLVFLLLFFFCFSLGRGVQRQTDPPAFYVETHPEITVALGKGFTSPGIHQFSDGTTLAAVIALTDIPRVRINLGQLSSQTPLQNGQRYDLIEKNTENKALVVSWMRAAKRIAAGVPLHPDRMSLQDWEDLPGIGSRLAEKIESDRQLNGDFGSLSRLQRVKGIGKGRVGFWKEIFGDN